MNFDNAKVNVLLAEMEEILKSIKATRKAFTKSLERQKQKAA